MKAVKRIKTVKIKPTLVRTLIVGSATPSPYTGNWAIQDCVIKSEGIKMYYSSVKLKQENSHENPNF